MLHSGRPHQRLFGDRTIFNFTVNRLGVTGTDTGVGKTVVTSAIVTELRQSGRRVAAMKPVETGGSDDAEQLRAASGDLYPLDLVRPIALPEPLAPLIAARRAGVEVDLRRLDQAFETMRTSSDTIVVEGAGGILVPITEDENFATLFKRWQLDVVIVAANRLGVINHTLLTVESALRYGLSIQGIVLNTIHDAPPTVAEATNQALLAELLPSIPIHVFPYLSPS